MSILRRTFCFSGLLSTLSAWLARPEKCSEFPPDEWSVQIETGTERESSERLLQDVFDDNGLRVIRWISVKERLPEVEREVIVVTPDKFVKTAWLEDWGLGDGLQWFSGECGYRLDSYSHWAELPNPPDTPQAVEMGAYR